MLSQGAGSANSYSLARPWLDCTQALFEPAPLTRVRARLGRLKLVHALAEGAAPVSSPLFGSRAAQLVSPAARQRLAVALERLVLTGDGPAARWQVQPR